MLHRTLLISVWCARTLLTFSAEDRESWYTVAYVYCTKNILGSIYCTYNDPADMSAVQGSCPLYLVWRILLTSIWFGSDPTELSLVSRKPSDLYSIYCSVKWLADLYLVILLTLSSVQRFCWSSLICRDPANLHLVYRDPAFFYLGYRDLANLPLVYRDPADLHLEYPVDSIWCTAILLTSIWCILLTLSGLQGPTDLYLM